MGEGQRGRVEEEGGGEEWEGKGGRESVEEGGTEGWRGRID